MKSIEFKKEITTSVVLIIILIAFLNPSGLLMPTTMEIMLVVFLILIFLSYSAVFWNEGRGDERENYHRLNAGRMSFLAGSALLVIGIILQSRSHNIDPWLIVTLVAMVLVKIVSRIVSKIRN